MVIRLKSFLITLYFFGTLFLFAFVNFNGATAFYDMTVPFIKGTVIVWHFAFSVLLVFLYIFIHLASRQEVRVDVITICLLIKSILDALPMFFFDVEVGSYFWHYACTLASLMAYFIISNIHMDEHVNRKFKTGLQWFGVILSVQVIYTAMYCGYSYLDIYYKSAMVIPYGGTNIIAAILVPILCMVLLTPSTNEKKLICFIIFTVAIILTKSRGGMLMETILVTYLAYRRAGQKNNRAVKRLLIFVFVALFAIAVLSGEDMNVVLSGYISVNSNRSFVDALTSGRIGSWINALETFWDGNIVFGSGMQSLSGNTSGAHNIVIDLLVKCGVIGFINYLVAFFFMLKRGRWLYAQKNTVYFIAVISIYLNALFEVNYFSYECDVMLWIIIGAMMSEYYSVRRQMSAGSCAVARRERLKTMEEGNS